MDEQLSLGQKYLNELNYENAIIAFQKIIEVDPKNVPAYLGLADAYEKTDRNEEAIGALEKVIEIEPENEEAYIKISDIYIKIDDIENAIKILMEALSKINSKAISQKLDKINEEYSSKDEETDENVSNDEGNTDLNFEFNTSIDLSSGFNVEVLNDRTAILYMRDSNLMPTYTVGEYFIDGELMTEHSWIIMFDYGTNSFEAGTISFNEVDSATEVYITDMEHDLWIKEVTNENKTHFDFVNELGFKVNNDVLAYKVTVPDAYDFNFNEINSYDVAITHDKGDNNYDEYTASYIKDDSGSFKAIN
ncbi:tetratricopeptide repeat protein [Sedimentibacter saalensis]|uniref:tetratricopeptide repeat protein n=1 Tax=Sedimentibacter saalensis TaxID=130788 RepID=UPI00289C567A|nr:tetratricopeptide repeat protein [Sedimentibacter saalensis]